MKIGLVVLVLVLEEKVEYQASEGGLKGVLGS
jgi:hypothetical protein